MNDRMMNEDNEILQVNFTLFKKSFPENTNREVLAGNKTNKICA